MHSTNAGVACLSAVFGLQIGLGRLNMCFESNRLMQLSEQLQYLGPVGWGATLGTDDDSGELTRIMAMTVQIVTAYVSKNELGVDGLVSIIDSTRSTLSNIDAGGAAAEPVRQEPVVPVEKSVRDQYLICLEDGRRLKTLRRHLHAAYGMTPEDYRAKWNLPPDYPMVAPAYSRQRSEFAKQSGLGKKQGS